MNLSVPAHEILRFMQATSYKLWECYDALVKLLQFWEKFLPPTLSDQAAEILVKFFNIRNQDYCMFMEEIIILDPQGSYRLEF